MERLYETTVILDPDLGREDVDAEVGKLVEIIKNHSGETEVTHVGRRGLEYPISNKRYGQYVLLTHGGDQAVVADLERQILINEHLLRHLTVCKDKFAPSDSYEAVEESTGRSPRGRGGEGAQRSDSRTGGRPRAEETASAEGTARTEEAIEENSAAEKPQAAEGEPAPAAE